MIILGYGKANGNRVIESLAALVHGSLIGTCFKHQQIFTQGKLLFGQNWLVRTTVAVGFCLPKEGQPVSNRLVERYLQPGSRTSPGGVEDVGCQIAIQLDLPQSLPISPIPTK